MVRFGETKIDKKKVLCQKKNLEEFGMLMLITHLSEN